jgi:hypothetical protein
MRMLGWMDVIQEEWMDQMQMKSALKLNQTGVNFFNQILNVHHFTTKSFNQSQLVFSVITKFSTVHDCEINCGV